MSVVASGINIYLRLTPTLSGLDMDHRTFTSLSVNPTLLNFPYHNTIPQANRDMATYLITGSSRGLGLALVRHLASLPETEVSTIFAASRQGNPPNLQELLDTSSGRVECIQLDVTNWESIQDAAREVDRRLQGKGIDVLVNNAGVMLYTAGGVENMDELIESFNTNVNGAHLVTRAFLPLLRKGERKVVVNMSTTVGSITGAATYKDMPFPAYKITKAALNALTVQYAQDYASEGFTFLAVSPGWLRTDMGGSGADLPVEKGAEKVIDIVRNATTTHNGQFLNIHVPEWVDPTGRNQYDGKQVPW